MALVILYYLPGIIQSACNPCEDVSEINEQRSQSMDDYSDDVLEEMK